MVPELKKLLIIGAGGFGREVAWLVERINRSNATWELLGFLDDNTNLYHHSINRYPVLGTVNDAIHYPDAFFVCAIGAASVRQKVIHKLLEINPNAKFGTLVDPSAEMSDDNQIGEGTIICAHSILTVNICIGRHVIVNLDCTIGHDVVLEDFVTVCPGVNISGNVHIGEVSELGTGVKIIPGKTVGRHSIVGVGAVVVYDIPEDCVAVGMPARPVKPTLSGGLMANGLRLIDEGREGPAPAGTAFNA